MNFFPIISIAVAAMLIWPAVYGSAPAQLLENGDAESAMTGWSGDAVLSASEVFGGKYSFAVEIGDSGSAAMFLAAPVPVNAAPGKFYFSGVFMASGERCSLSVEVQLFDRYLNRFDLAAASPVPGSETKMLKAVRAGKKEIDLAPEANWRAGDDVAAVFGAADDLSDLPNLNFMASGIAEVVKREHYARVTLKEPLTRDYPAGQVRLHRLVKMVLPIDGAALPDGEFVRISGDADCGVKVAYAGLRLDFTGPPGSRIVMDDLALSVAPLKNRDLPAGLAVSPEKQRQFMEFYTDFGYRMDRSYYDFGTAVDMAAMRLEANGKPAEKLWRDSADLRDSYLRLSGRLEDFAAGNSLLAAGAVLQQRRGALELELAQFEAQGKKLAASAEKAAEGLKYPEQADFMTPGDYLFSRFILGMDVAYKFYSVDKLRHSGNYFNPEYVAMALNRAGVNLISLEVIRNQDWRGFVGTMNRLSRSPFLFWSTDAAFAGGDSGSYDYFGNVSGLVGDASDYLKNFSEFDHCAGLQLDEPLIADDGSLIRRRAVVNEWRPYAQELSSELTRRKFGASAEISQRRPATVKAAATRVEYLAWQLFKKNFLGRHLEDFYNMFTATGKLVSTVLIDWNSSAPQATSFVSVASRLPYVGSDLYENGSLKESFSMQLLRSAARDRAVMWPGGGYSCKSSPAFNRSLATGLAYGDGIHVWTYDYCAKYRDPNLFWRFGADAPALDDRGRPLAGNWAPYLWGDLEEFYRMAAGAGRSIDGCESEARVALLHSELQTIMSDNPGMYFNRQVGLYSAMVFSGIPCDVEFIECLTPEKLAGYKLLVVSDLQMMSDRQLDMLRGFVSSGGVLAAFGRVATEDEWGRARHGFALSDLFGVDGDGVIFGAGSCDTPAGWITADRNSEVLRVSSTGKARTYPWNTGGVGLAVNSFGDGMSYYCSLASGGYWAYEYGFYPGVEKLLAFLAGKYAELPIGFEALPSGVEVSVRRNRIHEQVIVLINRTGMFGEPAALIQGHRLRLKTKEPFSVFNPADGTILRREEDGAVNLPPFEDCQILIVRKTE